jgi:DNA invertase Pin-like site-specific DNA recombinase
MKITALYSRLSVGDEARGNDESNSIKYQKQILEEFAKKNNFINTKHYIDDDESGRFFDRPAYTAMKEDIRNGKVDIAICKDLSRWGRNYLEVGNAIKELRQMNVRLIAIYDNVDSINEDSIKYAPFINIFNEFHVIETSKKIRASNKTKGMSGKPLLTSAPYGYIKSPDNKYKWLVDDEAAEVVRRIFQLRIEGFGPYQICSILRADKIPMPAYYLKQKGIGLHKTREFQDPYNWTNGTVTDMLRRQEYCGDIVNFKTHKHLDDKKCTYTDKSEWQIFENVHEPIIDRTTFETVQRLLDEKLIRRPNYYGYIHPLSGLLYCKDCGGKLHIHRIDNRKERPTGICSNYTGTAKTKGRHEIVTDEIFCKSAHRIEAAKVMDLLQITLRNLIKYVLNNKDKFVATVQKNLEMEKSKDFEKQKKLIPKHQKRLKDLDILLDRIYEDNALGKLDEERYQSRHKKYTEEYYRLKEELQAIEGMVECFSNGNERVRKFIEIVEKYATFEEITQTMLNEFINKIVVHEKEDKGSRLSPQRVELHFNYIGEFKPAEPQLYEAEIKKMEEERAYRQHRREIQKRHREKLKLMKARETNAKGATNTNIKANVS